MVTLPPDFIAIKYPGYFWHSKEKKLYSMKVSGVLHPLSGPAKPNRFNYFIEGYTVSVKGRRRRLTMDYLTGLKAKDSVIPVEKV